MIWNETETKIVLKNETNSKDSLVKEQTNEKAKKKCAKKRKIEDKREWRTNRLYLFVHSSKAINISKNFFSFSFAFLDQKSKWREWNTLMRESILHDIIICYISFRYFYSFFCRRVVIILFEFLFLNDPDNKCACDCRCFTLNLFSSFVPCKRRFILLFDSILYMSLSFIRYSVFCGWRFFPIFLFDIFFLSVLTVLATHAHKSRCITFCCCPLSDSEESSQYFPSDLVTCSCNKRKFAKKSIMGMWRNSVFTSLFSSSKNKRRKSIF